VCALDDRYGQDAMTSLLTSTPTNLDRSFRICNGREGLVISAVVGAITLTVIMFDAW
jgi:hypothetical protein